MLVSDEKIHNFSAQIVLPFDVMNKNSHEFSRNVVILCTKFAHLSVGRARDILLCTFLWLVYKPLSESNHTVIVMFLSVR